MSTHVPGFQSFSFFLHYFILAELASSSIMVRINLRKHLDIAHSVHEEIKGTQLGMGTGNWLKPA